MFKILQRYVFREVLTPSLLTLATLTFIFLIQTVFLQADSFSAGISFGLLMRFICYSLPSLLSLTVPMALLTGVLLGVGRLAADGEVQAFRTHGVNLFRVFIPVVLLGIVCSFFVLANTLYFAPHMLSKSFDLLERLRYELIDSLEPGRFEDQFSSRGADTVLYFGGRDPETGFLQRIYLCLEGAPKEFDELMAPAQENRDAAKERQETAVAWSHASREFQGGEGIPLDPAVAGRIARLDAYTVEFWAQTISSATTMTILGLSGGPEGVLDLGVEGDRVGFRHTTPGGEVSLRPDGARITDGSWHYVALVKMSPGEWRLHFDGVLSGTVSGAAGPHPVDRAVLGASARTGPAQGWIGRLGDVRISTVARGETDIEKNWNQGRGKALEDDADTILLWRPDEDTEAQGAKETAGPPEAKLTAPRTKILFLAPTGELKSDPVRHTTKFTLHDGAIHFMRGRQDESYTIINFTTYTQEFQSTSEDMEKRRRKRGFEPALTFAEIRGLADELRAERAQAGLSDKNESKQMRYLRAELWQRISISAACFAFVLVALPLAVYVRPSGKSVGIAIAFCLVMAYYGVMQYGITLIREGGALGPLMAFLPNVLLTIAGGILFHRTVHR